MSKNLDLITRLYAVLLRLYPSTFRAEFGGEMRTVFALTMTDARTRGIPPLITSLFRELVDFPANLLHEHWHEMTKVEKTMTDAIRIDGTPGGQGLTSNKQNQPGSWHDAILAGIPHLLLWSLILLPELLFAAGLLSSEDPTMEVFYYVLTVGVILVLISALIIAWRRGWPRWSASWYPYFWGLAIPVFTVLSKYWDAISQANILGEIIIQVIIPLVIAWGLYRVTRQDRVKGLLTALPFMIVLWQPMHEFVPARFTVLLNFGMMTITALVAATILRLGSWQTGVWLVIGAGLLVGFPNAYIGIYHGGMLPYTAPGPNLVEVMRSYIPHLLAVSTLVIGPLLARSFREIGMRSGTTGRWSYRLSLFGLLLVLAGNLSSFFIGTDDRLWTLRQEVLQLINFMVDLGVLFYLIGVLVLGLTALRLKTLPGRMTSLLLALLPLGLPLVLMLPLMYGMRVIPQGMPYGLPQLNRIPTILVFTFGLSWLMLVVRLIIYLPQQEDSPNALVSSI
jgi:hypothetical protein